MLLSRCSATSTLLLALALSPLAFGQVQTGVPAFGSFSGGPFDTVNNANLNVHFGIPVLNKPGPLPFYYILSYDSSVWQTGIGSTWVPVSNWGWQGVTNAETGYIRNVATPETCITDHQPYTVWNGWRYYDPFGTIHVFPITTSDISQTACTGPYPDSETAATTDGSGYTMNATDGGANVVSSSGMTIIPGYSIADPNGNTITTDGSNFYDTLLGTAQYALNVTGTAPNPTIYKFPNSNVAGGYSTLTMNYKSYTVQTNFGCGSPAEYPATAAYLVDNIVLPDGSTYSFTYETTPSHSPNVTARIASVTLSTGGTISYSYTGGSNHGIMCSDGTAAGLNRTTPDSTTAWGYSRTVSGNTWTTTLTDPSPNTTTYTFYDYNSQGPYEAKRTNSLETVYTCYNGDASSGCTASLTLPIAQRTVTTTLGSLKSKANAYYNTLGLPTELDEFDFGSGSPGGQVRKTTTTYPTPSANCGITNTNIVNRPCIVSVYAGTATTPSAQTTNTYDASGNLLKAAYATSSTTTTINKSFTYNTNGTVNVATDVNGNQTTYGYSGSVCDSGLPTQVTLSNSITLTRLMTWDCDGGVLLSIEDEENEATTSFTYDEMWRPNSTTDPTSALTSLSYGSNPSVAESTLNFNSGTSTLDVRTQLDPLGRTSLVQRKQGPGPPTTTNYDSVQTTYDALGRPAVVTMPYSATAGSSAPTGTATTKTTYDVLGRPTEIDAIKTDGTKAGYSTFTYNSNDVLRTLKPAPTGENAKSWQYEYDALVSCHRNK